MSTREKALYIFNRLTDEQLAAFVTLFSGERFILEEAPDSWDRAMIADSREDNSEVMPFNDFVKELGFNPDELRN
ncbi:MAG: hypothetical protein HDT47_00915 [Ruminococcaceae bacterium]|nr:hypothetical protein [Oscillospiraceae bacterium]